MLPSTKYSGFDSFLPDANVWLALCSDGHVHHWSATSWFDSVQQPIYLCRVTQMALLRLLSNRRVMGPDLLNPQEAVSVYKALFSDERIHYASEPEKVEDRWFSLMEIPVSNGSVWSDAWLAALALTHGLKLISFDAGMRRWAKLNLQLLAT